MNADPFKKKKKKKKTKKKDTSSHAQVITGPSPPPPPSLPMPVQQKQLPKSASSPPGQSRPLTPLESFAAIAHVHRISCNHAYTACLTCSRGIACCACNGLHTAPAHLQLHCTHCLHYTCATCTTRACGMLGNSLRSIGPKQRSLAYQACVLPILQYGSALWYAPGGTRVIKHVKRMECVHSFAMGWIMGTFRTTPLGARGLIAGIPPLHILLNLRFHGLQARLTTLDDCHIAHATWSLWWLNLRIRNVRPRMHPHHLPSDNPIERLATDLIREQFIPFHPLSRPGNRVVDRFSNFIVTNAYSLKKGSSLFKAWLSDLVKDILALHSLGWPIIYTDDTFWNGAARGSYSFTCFHHGTWFNSFNWCPSGSSFNSKIAAIEQAIQWACVQRLNDPVFFVDNKAALCSFLDTCVRSSHMATIRINELLMDHFSTHPTHMTFRYCPSHSGVEGNNRADRLMKLGAAIALITPPRILLSNFINDHAKRMTMHWRILAAS